MFTSEDFFSRKGKQLKKIDNQVYRFGRKIRSGDVWRCVRKMCKAKVLICEDSVTPKNFEHNHSNSYKSLKVENQKNFENSSKTYHVETSDDDDTDDNELNGLQEENKYDSNKKLFHYAELDNKKTFCDKATNTEKSVRSIGVNTIESSFTCNKPRRKKLKKTRDLTNSQNNSPQANFNMVEPDEAFNKNESFKSSANRNLLYSSAQGSTCSDTIESPFNYNNWDDPNELVDHLRVLVTERELGFTGHDNEIQLIIEELRKADIIY